MRTAAVAIVAAVALAAAACNPLGGSQVASDYRPDVTLSAERSQVLADRSRLQVGNAFSVYIYARDATGQPFVSPTLPVAILLAGDPNAAQVGAVVNRGDGSYAVGITARLPGTLGPFSVRLGDVRLTAPPISVAVASATLSALPAAFTLTPSRLVAGGQASVFLRLQDSYGVPLAHGGQAVRFSC